MSKFDLTRVRRSDFYLVLSFAGVALVANLFFALQGPPFAAVCATLAFGLLAFTAGSYAAASSRSLRQGEEPRPEPGHDYFPDLEVSHPWMTAGSRLRQGVAILVVVPLAGFAGLSIANGELLVGIVCAIAASAIGALLFRWLTRSASRIAHKPQEGAARQDRKILYVSMLVTSVAVVTAAISFAKSGQLWVAALLTIFLVATLASAAYALRRMRRVR